MNTFSQTENIKHSNIGTSMNKVSHGTLGTQMYRGNTSSQTNPINQVELGKNKN